MQSSKAGLKPSNSQYDFGLSLADSAGGKEIHREPRLIVSQRLCCLD